MKGRSLNRSRSAGLQAGFVSRDFGTAPNSRIRVRSTQPLTPRESKSVTSALTRNAEFFGFKISSLTIVICHSKREWKAESKYYFHPLARGLVLRDGTVVVKSRKLGGISLKKWENILTHEVNHSYWCSLSRRGRDLWSPLWLVEGLACIVGKNYPIRSSQELQRRIVRIQIGNALPFRYRAALVRTAEEVRLRYSIWREFVEWMYRRNRRGLLRVVASARLIRSEAHFDRIMKTSMGNTPAGFFEEFVRRAQIRKPVRRGK